MELNFRALSGEIVLLHIFNLFYNLFAFIVCCPELLLLKVMNK